MEGALEGDDPVPLGLAQAEPVAPRHLDGAFQRLGTRVADEAGVGEGGGHEAVGQPLELGDADDVGDVPELLRLLLHRLHEVRVGMAQQRHRDPARHVEPASPVAVEEPRAFATLEGEVGALVDRQERGDRLVLHDHACAG